MNENEVIEDFWGWFQSFEFEIYLNYENPNFMKHVDTRVNKISLDLSWEIGPIGESGIYFSLSPEMNGQLMRLAAKTIAHSYESKLWKFLVGRQRRPWSDLLEVLDDELNSASVFNLSEWTHVVYKDKEDGLYDIVFSANCRNHETEDLIRIANIAAIGLLGEVVVMEQINSIEVVSFFEEKTNAVAKPIYWLPYALGMKPME